MCKLTTEKKAFVGLATCQLIDLYGTIQYVVLIYLKTSNKEIQVQYSNLGHIVSTKYFPNSHSVRKASLKLLMTERLDLLFVDVALIKILVASVYSSLYHQVYLLFGTFTVLSDLCLSSRVINELQGLLRHVSVSTKILSWEELP